MEDLQARLRSRRSVGLFNGRLCRKRTARGGLRVGDLSGTSSPICGALASSMMRSSVSKSSSLDSSRKGWAFGTLLTCWG
ncbi:hypothetical protein KCU68_g111, partial [Aureobasidium melanogenum]